MTSTHSDPRTIRERLTLTAPAAKATARNTLADKLMLVGILDLKSLDAVETFVESRIRRIRQAKLRAKGRRAALITRLRAAHACSKAEAPAFVQLTSTGVKKWRCDGCLTTVTLKKGA